MPPGIFASDLHYILPELVLTGGALVLLVADVLVRRRLVGAGPDLVEPRREITRPRDEQFGRGPLAIPLLAVTQHAFPLVNGFARTSVTRLRMNRARNDQRHHQRQT